MREMRSLDDVVRAMFEMLLREEIREAVCQAAHQDIAMVLEARFGDVPRDLVDAIESVVDEKQLKDIVRSAAACPDLAAFRCAMTRGCRTGIARTTSFATWPSRFSTWTARRRRKCGQKSGV